MIRRAKECLNAIDPVDVKRSYRFEQGFTFELNLSGVSDEARDAFVEKTDADVHEVGRRRSSRVSRRRSCAASVQLRLIPSLQSPGRLEEVGVVERP